MCKNMNKITVNIFITLLLLILNAVLLSGCIEEKVPYEKRNPPIIKITEEYINNSFEELYRDTPTNLTDRKAWEQWESKYKGKYVKETGMVDGMVVLPQEGELFFIITLQNKEGHVGNNVTQVAFSVECAFDVRVGDTYTFIGKISNFSSFDENLVYSGHEGLIIVEGRLIELEKE